ncbi:MAG TPA: succinate dehydrogenase assembly factor 4 [Rhizomicrobium sp.]
MARPKKSADIAVRIREAGKRARAEAEARAQVMPELPRELGGPAGPEPTRYGDWERKGIASDF